MPDMATHPTPLRPSAHHGYESWTCTWYDDQKRRRTKRFGRVDEIGKREAQARYRRWLGEWETTRHIQNPADPTGYTVGHLVETYREHCKTVYVKHGKETSHRWQVNAAMDAIKESLGGNPVDSIEASDIVKLRDGMIESMDRHGEKCHLSIYTVNGRLRIIKQMFAWARLYGLVQKATAYDVSLVPSLRVGRSKAKPPAKILPVPEDTLNATLAVATPTISAMIRLQVISGMRSGEMISMRVCDLVKDGELLIYRPVSHKTEHHDIDRVIVLGRQAQELIAPFIARRVKLSEFVFLPAESHSERLEQIGYEKVTAYQMSRSVFKPGRAFNTGSYYSHVYRTCDRAFDPKGEKIAKRDYSHRWHPHQLRHNAATRLREEFGMEAANDAMGHTTYSMTERYAEKSLERLKEIARKVG